MVFNIGTISGRVADELIAKACLREVDGAFSCVPLCSHAVCLPLPAGPPLLMVKWAVTFHHFKTPPLQAGSQKQGREAVNMESPIQQGSLPLRSEWIQYVHRKNLSIESSERSKTRKPEKKKKKYLAIKPRNAKWNIASIHFNQY